MRIRVLFAAAIMAPALIVIGLAPPSSASNTPRLASLRAGASQAAGPCGNTIFSPQVPNGAQMDQTYVNCSGYTVEVCPGYLIGNSDYVAVYARRTIGPGREVQWYWPSTTRGASYTTAFCDDASPVVVGSGPTPHPVKPCWTSFYPNIPDGQAMYHNYGNCTSDFEPVLPAYWLEGSLYVATGAGVLNGGYVPLVSPEGETWWWWPYTVKGADYTTVYQVFGASVVYST
jgi:hypothetical protein